eukprot:jgi/Bigna1/79699/fgenesh1_pg.64_\
MEKMMAEQMISLCAFNGLLGHSFALMNKRRRFHSVQFACDSTCKNKAELEAAFDKDVFREKESQVIPKRSLFGGLGSYYEDNELSVSDDEEEIDTEEGIDALRLKKLKEKERAHYEKQLGIDLKGIQTEPWGAADMEDNIRMKYYKALLRANKEKQEEEEDEGDEEDADYKRRRSSSMRKTSERIRDNVSLGILQDDGENTDDVVEKMVIPESEKQYLSEWRITKQDPDDLHRVYRPNIDRILEQRLLAYSYALWLASTFGKSSLNCYPLSPTDFAVLLLIDPLVAGVSFRVLCAADRSNRTIGFVPYYYENKVSHHAS